MWSPPPPCRRPVCLSTYLLTYPNSSRTDTWERALASVGRLGQPWPWLGPGHEPVMAMAIWLDIALDDLGHGLGHDPFLRFCWSSTNAHDFPCSRCQILHSFLCLLLTTSTNLPCFSLFWLTLSTNLLVVYVMVDQLNKFEQFALHVLTISTDLQCVSLSWLTFWTNVHDFVCHGWQAQQIRNIFFVLIDFVNTCARCQGGTHLFN